MVTISLYILRITANYSWYIYVLGFISKITLALIVVMKFDEIILIILLPLDHTSNWL